MKSKFVLITTLASALAFSVASMAQTPAPATKAPATKEKEAATPAPSAADIAAAKSKGMVWVNTSTKVYHSDGEFYGKTKRGKFMTEDDAKKAGFKAAKEPAAAKAKTDVKK